MSFGSQEILSGYFNNQQALSIRLGGGLLKNFFDFTADFSAQAYRTRAGATTYSGMFYNRLPAPTTSAGLTIPDNLDNINRAYIGLNDPDLRNVNTGTSNYASLVKEVVEVADLPAGAKAYFEGLSLVWPVERVFRLQNPTGGIILFQSLSASITSGSKCASAYVYKITGSITVRTGGGATSGNTLTDNTGGRLSATDAGTVVQVGVGAGGECYVAGFMLNEGTTPGTYIDADQIRNRIEPRDTSFLSAEGGLIVCRVLWPVEGTGGGDEVFGLANSDRSTVLRCTINWVNAGDVTLSLDNGTTTENISSLPTWAPDKPVTIAAYYTATGEIKLSVDGADLKSAASGIDASGLTRLRVGGAFSRTFQHNSSFLGGNLELFAYRGGVI